MAKCLYCSREIKPKYNYPYCNETCKANYNKIEESALLKICPPIRCKDMSVKEIELQKKWFKKNQIKRI